MVSIAGIMTHCFKKSMLLDGVAGCGRGGRGSWSHLNTHRFKYIHGQNYFPL